MMTGAAMTSALVMPFAVSAHMTTQTGETNYQGTPTSKLGKHPYTAMLSTSHKFSPPVNGTVTAISGTTLTVTNATGTVYTVDASQAKVAEGMFVSGLSVANIQVGDKVSIRGTVSGTTITAKMINDASFIGRNIFTGIVSSVSGSMITISSKNATTSTIDAASATITSGIFNKKTITTSDLKVGDRLTIVGAINGSVVTASSIQDLGQMHKIMHPKKGLGHKPGKTNK